jgi:cardiolipin synthase C
MRRMLTSTTLALAGLLFTGCASVPEDYPRTTSTAYQDYLDTSLGQLFEEVAVQHPGESGFAMIRYGRRAFTTRVALTELAEQSLDLQYYIWEDDATGRILAERLIRAADRGVRVRILVDDIDLAGRDAAIAAIDAHPNIEIRIFNPFARRDSHLLDFVFDLDRVNHRMHNKMMIADNAVAIVGGRNVGNIYFQVATDANYRDLDIAAAGPIVREISDVYDHFWTGDWAVPISALVDRPYTEADLRDLVRRMRQQITEGDYPYPLDQDIASLEGELSSARDELIWAHGQLVWDNPAAMREGSREGSMWERLFHKMDSLQDEIVIVSAYFVVQEPGLEKARALEERGVRVRILTNSLASNDVIAAHAGYAKHRKELIENSVELYELRADASAIKKRLVAAESRAGLHAKAIVFDRESVFIGSFNLDPRSAFINTEGGLYVESSELAGQLIAWMDEGMQPENSYRVLLDDDDDLVWLTEIDGREVRYDEEPGSSFGKRFMTDLIMMLPVQDQL